MYNFYTKNWSWTTATSERKLTLAAYLQSWRPCIKSDACPHELLTIPEELVKQTNTCCHWMNIQQHDQWHHSDCCHRSALGPSCGLSAGWLRPLTPDGMDCCHQYMMWYYVIHYTDTRGLHTQTRVLIYHLIITHGTRQVSHKYIPFRFNGAPTSSYANGVL